MSIAKAWFISLCMLVVACKETDGPLLVSPTDLEISLEESSTVAGRVRITASANNVNYFTFRYIEGADIYSETSNEGAAEYDFTTTGTHKVEVFAHATANQYISAIDSIRIDSVIINKGNAVPSNGATSPLTYNGYTLQWQDEFDGNALDLDNWNYELGTGANGWGNNELQYYRKENTTVDNGILTITAKKENAANSSFTSSRITTKAKQSFKYGRVDIRAALPKGQGLWPALWMLGESFTTVGWPSCGEIDIMELVGGSKTGNSDKVVHGTCHWNHNGSHASHGGSTALTDGDFSQEFHVFSIIWDDLSIKWLMDGVQYESLDIQSSGFSAFHEAFFFIFNVAVGGNWPGSPDETSNFPQNMHVDYIRVFQKN